MMMPPAVVSVIKMVCRIGVRVSAGKAVTVTMCMVMAMRVIVMWMRGHKIIAI